jgi:hypothetical protein
MYRVMVRHLNEQTMLAVADIFVQPPATGKYETLKNTLIERFSYSVEKQVRTLLGEMELGDKKPILLREMRTLAGANISDSLLRILWLQRLPARIQEILVVLDGVNLEKLAVCADKATECARITTVATVANTGPNDELQQLKQISELTQAVAKISTYRKRSRLRERKNLLKEDAQNPLTGRKCVITIEDLAIRHGSAYNRVMQNSHWRSGKTRGAINSGSRS